MATIVLGKDAKAYRNTGTYSSPTWSEITNIKDLTLSIENAEDDVTTRASGGWTETAFTLKTASIEFQTIWDPDDASFTALQTAFFNNTNIEMLIIDGSVLTTGSQGLRASMGVGNFSRSENLAEALKVDVSMKPTRSAHAPAWYEVT